MDTEGLALAELVAARLCHDLSGLAGTLGGMLELAEEDGGGGEALSVATGAAGALSGRLRLLRAAWGGPGEGRDVPFLEELLSHAAGFPRTRTDWTGCAPGPFAPHVSRFLLNAVLAGVEALPRGGVLRVSGGSGGAFRLELDGPVASWPAAWTPAALAGTEAPAVDPGQPRQLQPVLALLFARADGIRLGWTGGKPPALAVRT